MRIRYFISFLLISFLIPVHVEGFSLFEWIRGVFHSNKNSHPAPSENVPSAPSKMTVVSSEKKPTTMKRSSKDKDSWEANQIPITCDEDAIMMPLAHLKIISPEKIIELLATPSLEFTCDRVNSTIDSVNTAIKACDKFPTNHLYKKLCDGLEYFSTTICVDVHDDESKRNKSPALLEYTECYVELQDDLFDCEGPPDWFEKTNRSAACQYYNDIVDCNYIKAAMLCGKDAAKLLRDFSNAVMRKVLTFPCKISSSEPHMDDNLIASVSGLKARWTYSALLGLFVSLLNVF